MIANVLGWLQCPGLFHLLGDSYLEVKNLENQFNSISIADEDIAMSYYKIRQQLSKLSTQIEEFVHMPKYCLQFLQPGRMAKVSWECFLTTFLQQVDADPYCKFFFLSATYKKSDLSQVRPFSRFGVLAHPGQAVQVNPD